MVTWLCLSSSDWNASTSWDSSTTGYTMGTEITVMAAELFRNCRVSMTI